VEEKLIDADHSCVIGALQRLLSGRSDIAAKGIVVEQKKRGDLSWPTQTIPNREGVLRGYDTYPLTKADQTHVALLATELQRIVTVHQQLVVAGGPDHPCEAFAQ